MMDYAKAIRRDLPDRSDPPVPTEPEQSSTDSDPEALLSIEQAQSVLVDKGFTIFDLDTEQAVLKKGSIFEAALPHPYSHVDQPVHRRFYLVVGIIRRDRRMESELYAWAWGHGEKHLGIEICVVSLETNGRQGRYCYTEDNHRFIKSIRSLSKEEAQSKRQQWFKADLQSFYVLPSDWTPRETTVADLTTVLNIRSHNNRLLARHVTDLHHFSIKQLDKAYTALASWGTFATYMALRTPKVRKRNQPVSCERCSYCRAGKPCPLSLVSMDGSKMESFPPDTSSGRTEIWKSIDDKTRFWEEQIIE